MATRQRDECSLCASSTCGEPLPTRRTFLQSAGWFGLAAACLALTSTGAVAAPPAPGGDERQYPVPPADGVTIDRAAQLIVARADGHVYVFALSCPHENNAVKWVAKDHRFQCTKHDSQYRVDGVHTSGRATRNMDRYVIRREGDSIVVNLHRWVQSDKDPAGWAAAALSV